MTGSEQSPDYTVPKDAWKTDLLAVFLIFAFLPSRCLPLSAERSRSQHVPSIEGIACR